ncbi:hypothetical protein [Streptomyces hydrogenans]|uniref:hypothetical protein n=1 Tax=Streptomyces hydrogenans TaxID=1873719 RepID=UPI00382FF39D
MRWERAQDPVTWTTVDNAMVDADLSARAQGLLLRWLRRPPGAEIDDIGAMVKRSKREGKKRLEGRDALYKASYELEEEGFLVREQERTRTGQYEWVVRIYSSPVPMDKRSNPEDRKRAPRATPLQEKPRSAPVPENPELENQEPENQESGDQELSYKNSLKDSSLSGPGRPSGDGSKAGGERDSAPPDDHPSSADADVVVAAYEEASGYRMTAGVRQQFRDQALEVLATGRPVEWVAARAAEMPAKGWVDLLVQCARSTAPIPGQAGPDRSRPDRDPAMCWKPGHGSGAYPADDCSHCVRESRPRREGPAKVDPAVLVAQLRAGRAAAEARR